jgi:hypothetical protein
MGFNRRKIEVNRKAGADKEVAARRATDPQVLEDAARLIADWNERQARRMSLLFSPTNSAPLLPLDIGSCGDAAPSAEQSI